MTKKPAILPPWVRLVREPDFDQRSFAILRTPEDVVRAFADLRQEEVEVLCVGMQNARGQLIGRAVVTRGLADLALAHPREVFRPAIAIGALSVVLVHNHPSGDPMPSAEDKAVTEQMVKAAELLDIRFVDHLILGAHATYCSLAQMGLVPQSAPDDR